MENNTADTPQEKNSREQTADIDSPRDKNCRQAPCILGEIKIEELAIDGICGVY